MSKLSVLQCVVHEFGMYFLGFVVLGGVLYFFLSKKKARQGTALVALIV